MRASIFFQAQLRGQRGVLLGGALLDALLELLALALELVQLGLEGLQVHVRWIVVCRRG